MGWSYSSLKMYENCTYRYYRQRVKKDVKDYFESDEESYGVRTHKRLEQRLARKRPLPEEIASCEPICQELERAKQLHVEFQMALSKNLYPTEWYDRDAWSRAAADVLTIDDDAITIVDWKTGKVRYDDLQGMILAFHAHVYYPDVRTIRTRFIFTRHGVEKGDTYDMTKDLGFIWSEIKERVQEIAWSEQNNAWPKKKSGLCGWCPIKDCEHWYERS